MIVLKYNDCGTCAGEDYPNFNLMCVLIISAQIPDEEKYRREIVLNTRFQTEKHPALKRCMLLVHRDKDYKSLPEYFAPNLLPYLRPAVLINV